MGFRIINGVSYPVGNFPINNSQSNEKKNQEKINGTVRNFQDILQNEKSKADGFKISNHAAMRMEDMKLDKIDLVKINEAINRAQDKGARNCLIVYKDVAMVTSIENRTVITAVSGDRAKENVFTNIDSVVIL